MKVKFQFLTIAFLLLGFAAIAQPSNDNYANAIDVSSIINTCSANAAYTNVSATTDMGSGSCSNGSGYNVWFKFQATATTMNVKVDRGGSQGTIRRVNLTVWDTTGLIEQACNRYVNNDDDVEVGAKSLTIGDWYYISIDNNYSGYVGTFTLCLDTNLNYDYIEGAIDVSAYINSCTPDAAYTTIGATMDQTAGSCSNGSGYNRWFKFQATSPFMNVTIDIGSSQGTMKRTSVTMWKASDTTQIVCNRYVNNNDDVEIGTTSLTVGDWYYISVDNNYSGYRGTFTICLSTAVSYDYYQGAIDISAYIGSCTPDAAYTTIGATMDQTAGSCSNGSGYNRWFKFQATSSLLTITADIGGTKGNMKRTNITLWDSTLSTEIECSRYVNNNDDVELGALSLTVGDWYYISIDNNYSGYRGTFTLCLDTTVGYDFYEGAKDISAYIGSCTPDAIYTTIGATMDQTAGSCSNGSGYNRWFKFQATSPILTITTDIGGTKGTMKRTNIVLWDSTLSTEIECSRYVNNNDDVELGALSLTVGDWYYISIDNNYSGYRGTFTLCLDTTVGYDFYEGAKDISTYLGTCTPDAIYTTIGATMDKSQGSCNNGSGYNRWFKFQAISPELNISVQLGGTTGTIKRVNIALWDSTGISEIECNRYVNNNDIVEVDAISLVTGDWYYISIDNNYSGYRGTFTVCLDTTPSYDYYEGAHELTDLNNYCSPDAAFTTIGATMDKSQGSCNNGSGYNRWFKFQAISSDVTIDITRGGTLGTIKRINATLWESDGSTEIDCFKYTGTTNNGALSSTSLTPGNWYYISVDNNYSGFRGTFTLCINNVGSTYYSRASGNWNAASTWSLVSHVGTAAPSAPGLGDIVYIDGHTITVTATDSVAEINISVVNGASSLVANGNSLYVMGQFNLDNSGYNNVGSISVTNGGYLYVNDNLTLTRSGGTQGLALTIATGSELEVHSSLSVTSTGGTTNDNSITLNGTANLIVDDGLTLVHTAGIKTLVTQNDGSTTTITGDFTLLATADDKVELALNDSSNFTLRGDVVRGATKYGKLTCSDNSTLQFEGSVVTVTIPEVTSAGTTDEIVYKNVVLNPVSPSTVYTVSINTTISGKLTLTSGTGHILSGAALTVDGGIHNNSLIIIDAGGALVQTEAGANANSGSGSYEVNITGNNSPYIYNIWSSPLQNVAISTVFANTNPCDIWVFDHPTQTWLYDYTSGSSLTCNGNTFTLGAIDVITGGDGIMDPGVGYFIPGHGSDTRSFVGDINNGDIVVPVTTTSLGNNPNWDNDDWNLLGNPYPSDISATLFWNANTTNISDALYFWDAGDTTGGYNQYTDYASWNLMGGVNSGNSTTVPNGHITPGQGFWFYASATTNVVFNNSMRSDTTGTYFKNGPVVNQIARISFTSPSKHQNNILIGYNNQTTDGIDSGYDAHKLVGNAHVRFASMIGNEEFVIQGFESLQLGQEKVIPLTVFTDETGEHVFEEYSRENLPANVTVYLRDYYLNTTHNLTKSKYAVELTGNLEYYDRFELVFVYEITQNNPGDSTDITTNINTVDVEKFSLARNANGYTLSKADGIYGDIQIVDITGKLILALPNIKGDISVEINLSNLSSGVYFLNVIGNDINESYRQKLVKP